MSEALTHTIRVAVAGAAGRMGQTVCAAVESAADMELVGCADPVLGVTLAEVLYARGRHEEALGVVRGAEATYAQRSAKDPDLLQGLNLIAGKIEADLGNAAAAESSFEKEIALFPQDVRAYSNLAILYALTGRGAQASATLNRMIGAAPTAAAYAEAVKTYRVLHDPRGASAVLGYALQRFPRSPELRELARR